MAAKKTTKLTRKDKIWQKFCKLSRLDKYEMVMELCDVYDDFRYMLEAHKDFYPSLKELEKDLNQRLRRTKNGKA